ncbi:Hsp70 family protein [Patescibacteria group bacterium]
MSDFFGLDFGTSNSVLSVNINGIVRVIDIDKANISGPTMKTVIYFDDDDRRFYFGQEAVDAYIENDAFGRYVQSIKSFLPDKTFSSTSFGSKAYKLDEVVAIIFREIKSRGELDVGRRVDRVVIGRPVVFSEDPKADKLAEERLISAAKIAGFKEIYLQEEPIAAAVAYEKSSDLKGEKNILVGDLGGGTSDFAIARVGMNNERVVISNEPSILAVSGVHIGGDDFDSLIMWEKLTRYFGRFTRLRTMDSIIRKTDERVDMSPMLYKKLCEWHQIPRLRTPKIMDQIKRCKYLADDHEKQLIENLENLIDDNYGYMLFRSIETAKQDLSMLENTRVIFKERNLVIDEAMSRSEFEAIIASKIDSVRSCVEEVILSAGVKRDQIDTVVLTGGSSHIPCVKSVFTRMFPGKEVVHKNAFTGVAYGLGCYGAFEI